MRFLSLYSYSYRKSPIDLQSAILFCRFSLCLAGIAVILFGLGLLAASQTIVDLLSVTSKVADGNGTNTSGNIEHHNNNSGSSGKLVQTDTTTMSSGNGSFAFIDYSGLVCALCGSILVLCSILCAIISYRLYRNFRQSRLVSYELVNKNFDRLRWQQLSKDRVSEPIAQCGSTERIQFEQRRNNNNNNNSQDKRKFTNWARSKFSQNNNSGSARSASALANINNKKMTI